MGVVANSCIEFEGDEESIHTYNVER